MAQPWSGIRPGFAWGAALVLVLLLAAALRLPGLGWELPNALHPGYSGHPDEMSTFAYARLMAAGRLMLMQFIYGGTLYYSLLNAFYHYGSVLGGPNELSNTILFARAFFVACSLLTVLLTWRIGVRLFSPATGLLAALFLALSPAHAFLSPTMRPDVLSALAATLLVWLGVLILQGQAARDRLHFAAAGLLIGLVIALRFPLGVFGIASVLGYLLRRREAGWKQGCVELLRWRLPLLAVLAVLTYAAASPHSLLRPDLLRSGLELQREYQTGPFADSAERGPGLYQYGWLTLRQALGVPLHLLALAGVMLALLRRQPARLLLLVSVLVYFVPATLSTWVVVRYAVPILPLLALLAADALISFAAAGVAQRRIAAAAAVVLVAWTLLADLAFLRVQAGVNARELAAAWIETHVPKGASVVKVQQYVNDVYLTPALPRSDYRLFDITLGDGTEQLLLDGSADHDYLVLSSDNYRNMDRLGQRDPQKGAPALLRVLDSGHYEVAAQIEVPVRLLGLDFSDQFTSQDFNVINPGERIYRYVAAPQAGAGPG